MLPQVQIGVVIGLVGVLGGLVGCGTILYLARHASKIIGGLVHTVERITVGDFMVTESARACTYYSVSETRSEIHIGKQKLKLLEGKVGCVLNQLSLLFDDCDSIRILLFDFL